MANINALKNIVILISGNGSNLQAFIDAQKETDFGGKIVAVLSNKKDAFGLSRAKAKGIPAIVIQNTDFSSREMFDRALIREINKYQPELIVLAGFMRILTASFVQEFKGRLLNIHPSLLPKYQGLNTHQRALENKDAFHGSSVHFVTEELDGGPVISQAKIRLSNSDTVELVKERIQALEHKLYPATVKMFLSGQIELKEDTIYFENTKLEKAIALKVDK